MESHQEAMTYATYGGIAAVSICLNEIIKKLNETDTNFAMQLEHIVEDMGKRRLKANFNLANDPNENRHADSYMEGFDRACKILFRDLER